MADILEFPEKETEQPFPADERAMLMQTLDNLMNFQERLEHGMKLLTGALQQQDARIRDLEHEITNIKKPKKPVIFNATGARAN